MHRPVATLGQLLLIVCLGAVGCSERVVETDPEAAPDADSLDAADDADTSPSGDAGGDAAGGRDVGDASDAGDATTPDADAEPACESERAHGEGPPLATIDDCGRLTYGRYSNQGQDNADHILPDFSYAGYMQGGVEIPDAPTVITLEPREGDDLQRIEDAITQVADEPRGEDGLRGAVVLEAGRYEVDGPIEISTSGVVLRGEGQGEDGTVIEATREDQHDFIQITGQGSGLGEASETRTPITSDYVPVGSRTFSVETPSDFSEGDAVGVVRTPNQAWIDDLQMGQWGWTPASYEIAHERTVTDIDGDEITVDVPLVDTIESGYGGGELFKADLSGRVEQVGVENLRLVSHYDGADDEDHGWKAIRLRQAQDSWVRGVTAVHFGYAAVSIEGNSSHNTVEETAMLEPISQVTGARRYAFNVGGGTGNLFQRCYSEEARHDFVSGSRTTGPNVWLDCYSHDSTNDDGPHHRWATGLLFDNTRSLYLHVENRQDSGTGHGWSGAQTLFWNGMAHGIRTFAPHGAMNWMVGTMGTEQDGQWTDDEPRGWWESHNDPVEPRSLYLKQLEDRLGAAAVEAVTTADQRAGRIWGQLANWAGDGPLSQAPADDGEPGCADGVKSGLICCSASCGECGGEGCGSREGGSSECCTNHVKNAANPCQVYGPPCIVDPEFEPIP